MSHTINGMNSTDIKQLLRDTIENINRIEGTIEQIDSNLGKTNESKEKTNTLLFNIEEAYNEIYGFEGDENHEAKDSKLDELKKAYAEIIVGDDENKALRVSIEESVEYIETKKGEIEEFKKQVFGYENVKEDGTEEKVDGLFDNINKFHTSQKSKFDTLYKKIDKELTAGTTSVALAKVFSDKVRGYSITGILWQGLFVIIILFLLWSIDGVFDITDWKELLVKLLGNVPFFILSVWLLIFIGNRRAEAKKLEEGYKHKEVMARSFIGYKKSIEDLEGDIEDNDKNLMKLHMENLLQTINQDSSSFLSSEGDNHPLLDIFGNIFKRENFPNGSIETDYGKIEFNKK